MMCSRKAALPQGFPMVKVIENYHTFRPKADFLGTVEELLSFVPREYLTKLDRVLLTDSADLTLAQRRKYAAAGRLRRGAYSPGYKGKPPAIRLYLDEITATWPAPFLRLRSIREAILGRVLFHEIGHHVHIALMPDSRDREEVAALWMDRLRREYLARRYSRLRRLRVPLAWLWRAVGAILRWLVRLAEPRNESGTTNPEVSSSEGRDTISMKSHNIQGSRQTDASKGRRRRVPTTYNSYD
jgi:hypothetical protein